MDIPIVNLQAIFDQEAVGFAQIALDGVCLVVNNPYCQMLSYSEGELRTKALEDLTHPEDLAEALAGRRLLLEGSISSHSMEKRYIRKDGTVFWAKLQEGDQPTASLEYESWTATNCRLGFLGQTLRTSSSGMLTFTPLTLMPCNGSFVPTAIA